MEDASDAVQYRETVDLSRLIGVKDHDSTLRDARACASSLYEMERDPALHSIRRRRRPLSHHDADESCPVDAIEPSTSPSAKPPADAILAPALVRSVRSVPKAPVSAAHVSWPRIRKIGDAQGAPVKATRPIVERRTVDRCDNGLFV